MLDKPHGPPKQEELAGTAAATEQQGGRTDDDEASVASSGSEESTGSEASDYCLNVDGSSRVCAPQLRRRRQTPRDVLVSCWARG